MCGDANSISTGSLFWVSISLVTVPGPNDTIQAPGCPESSSIALFLD